MKKVNKDEVLRELEEVMPGLSTKEIVDQSSCFVFVNDKVYTYNDEVACQRASSSGLSGAVPAMTLINLLRKLPDEVIGVKQTESEVIIQGKNRSSGFSIDANILLPIDKIDAPKRWVPLHAEFIDALTMCKQCVSRDESEFELTCVHLHPEWVEAADNYQITRCKVPSGLKKSVLLRGASAGHIASLGATHIGETKEWVHFKQGELILSSRRYVDAYPDATKLFEKKGSPITLPKSLIEAAERAAVVTAENTDENVVQVEIRPGQLMLRGIGVNSWYKERKKVEYQGPELTFAIPPALLIQVLKNPRNCLIAPERLMILGESYSYVTRLGEVVK